MTGGRHRYGAGPSLPSVAANGEANSTTRGRDGCDGRDGRHGRQNDLQLQNGGNTPNDKRNVGLLGQPMTQYPYKMSSTVPAGKLDQHKVLMLHHHEGNATPSSQGAHGAEGLDKSIEQGKEQSSDQQQQQLPWRATGEVGENRSHTHDERRHRYGVARGLVGDEAGRDEAADPQLGDGNLAYEVHAALTEDYEQYPSRLQYAPGEMRGLV